MLLLLFHLICVFIYDHAIYYDYKFTKQENLELPIPGIYFSKFVWLTIINLVRIINFLFM